jgi:hypothetical protein
MSLHYTSTMTMEELDCDVIDTMSDTDMDASNSELNKIYSSRLKLSPYQYHVHHESLESQDCRDLHQLIIDMYNSLDNNEKNNPHIIKGFNKLIRKWHHTPQEVWKIKDTGIWSNTAIFLTENFPPNKYPKLIKIFNNC